MNTMTPAPRAFISYSWTTAEHEDWVMELATDLVESGVDVKLDKWNLREGQETSAFMESMVTDPTIQKVIIVCDRKYAEKSNSRQGGAGTEAQIISKGIFSAQDEGKFVVVSTEHDEARKPVVPAYYTSRMFIDFTDSSKRIDKFEQLLRWIFDKPLHKKPPLGQAPHYITNDKEAVTIPTSAAARRANDALTNGRPFAQGALEEYLEKFASYSSNFRPAPGTDILSEKVQDLLDDFIPFRNEVFEVITNACRFLESSRVGTIIHRFLENFALIFHPHEDESSYNPTAYNVTRFLGWELFMHICVIVRKSDRVDIFDDITSLPYISKSKFRTNSNDLQYFDLFSSDLPLFRERQNSLNKDGQRLLVPEARVLKERCAQSSIRFIEVEEMDFILFLRMSIKNYGHWVPQTLVYRGGHYSEAFPSFVRSTSRRAFDALSPYLGVNYHDFMQFIELTKQGKVWIPKWQHVTINIPVLSNSDKLCTTP